MFYKAIFNTTPKYDEITFAQTCNLNYWPTNDFFQSQARVLVWNILLWFKYISFNEFSIDCVLICITAEE